jgi:hypothetical protein
MAGIFLGLLYAFNAIFISFVLIGIKNNFTINFTVFGILLVSWFVIFLILSIRNIIYTNKLLKRSEIDKLKKLTEFIKFGAIPFWIINFILLSLFTIAIVMGTRGIGIVIIPVPILITYIILLGTSIFSIPYIKLLYRIKKIGFKQMVIHIILQLCFVWDVIGILYLKINNKKENSFKNIN